MGWSAPKELETQKIKLVRKQKGWPNPKMIKLCAGFKKNWNWNSWLKVDVLELWAVRALPPHPHLLSCRGIWVGERQEADSWGAVLKFLLFLTLLFYALSHLLLPCCFTASAPHLALELLVCSLATVAPWALCVWFLSKPIHFPHSTKSNNNTNTSSEVHCTRQQSTLSSMALGLPYVWILAVLSHPLPFMLPLFWSILGSSCPTLPLLLLPNPVHFSVLIFSNSYNSNGRFYEICDIDDTYIIKSAF